MMKDLDWVDWTAVGFIVALCVGVIVLGWKAAVADGEAAEDCEARGGVVVYSMPCRDCWATPKCVAAPPGGQ